MLSVVAGEQRTLEQILWYSLPAVGVSLFLVPAAGMGWIYALVAVIAGLGLVAFAVRLRSNRALAMRYFGFTNVYLASVFLAMLVDRVVLDDGIGGGTAWVLVGTALVAVGMLLAVATERHPEMRAPGVGPLRHVIEVGITVAFAAAIVVGAWATVLGDGVSI